MMNVIKKLLPLVICILMANFGFSQEYDIQWTDLNKCVQNGLVLEKSANGVSSAHSTDILFGENVFGFNDGYLTYTVDNTKKNKQLGFSLVGSGKFNKKDFLYSVRFHKTNQFQVVENDIVLGTHNYAVGDVVKIERIGTTLNYLLNGAVLHSTTVNSAEELRVSAILTGQGTDFNSVKRSFRGTPIVVDATINSAALSIDLSPSGGTAPYSYFWSSGARTSSITVPEPGTYRVLVLDADFQFVIRYFSVDQDVSWTDFYVAEEVNSTLRKLTSNKKWGGAVGTQAIPQNEDGWVEYSLNSFNDYKAFGFTPIGGQVKKPQDLQYGIYILDDNTMRVVENYLLLQNEEYAIGDVLKVERIGDEILYLRNGVEFHRTYNASLASLNIGGAVKNEAELFQVRCGKPLPKYSSTTFDIPTNSGSVVVNAPSTGQLPYQYVLSLEPIGELQDLWDAVKDTIFVDSTEFFRGNVNSLNHTISGVPPESYYLAVFDNTGQKIVHEALEVSPPIELHDDVNLNLVNGYVSRSQGAQTDGVGSLYGELLPQESGGFAFEVKEFGNYSIGFQNVSGNRAAATTDFIYGVEMNEFGLLTIYGDGNLIGRVGTTLNSEVRMAKESENFVLYVDNRRVNSYPIQTPLSESLKTSMIFKGVGKVKIVLFYAKFTWPSPGVSIDYVECGGIEEGGFSITSSFLTSIIPGTTSLVNNETSAVIATSSSLTSFTGLGIGTYTLTLQYNVGFFGPFTLTEQVPIGYVVDWENLGPNTALISNPNTIYQDPPTGSFDFAAEYTEKSPSGMENWIHFDTRMYNHYGLLSFPGTGNMQTVKLTEDGSTNNLTIWMSDFSSTVDYTFIYSAGSFGLGFSASPAEGSYRITELDGTVQVFKENVSLYGPVSTGSGNYMIQVSQKKKPQLIRTVTSYCPFEGPDQYVTPFRKRQGGYYQVPQDDVLKFEFYEEYDLANDLSYKIMDFKGEDMVPVHSLPGQLEEFGDNRYSIEVDALPVGQYVLELTNDKGEKWFLRFKRG